MSKAKHRGWSVVNTCSRRYHVASAEAEIRHVFGFTFSWRAAPPVIVYSDEKTPLERYILRSEEKIDEQESVIRQLRDKIEDIETKLERVKSDPLDGNICRNCHLRLGHTSRNCELDKCSSVFKCGLEKNPPGELKLKEMRLQLKKHESKLKQLTEELRKRKNAVDNVKDKQHIRIESDLLQTNRAAYMINGNQNWSLLRKHVYIVQQYCKKKFGRENTRETRYPTYSR